MSYKSYMKSFTLLCLFCISLQLYSQKKPYSRDAQHSLISQVYHEADSLCIIRPIDSLLNTDVITFPELKSEMFIEKAELLAKINRVMDKESCHDSLVFRTNLNEIMDCYSQALNSSACTYTLIIYCRYEFVKKLMSAHEKRIDDLFLIYLQDRKYLKSKGFKPERDGFGASFYFMKGKENYLGVDFSFYSSYEHENYITSKCDSITYTYRVQSVPIALNGLTLSYCRSLSGINDLSVSIVDFCSPISFSPLKLGYMTGPGIDQGFYYRPSIGLPIFGFITISYSYNFMLSKKSRTNSEKSLVYFKVSYPITNQRNKKWRK